MSSFGSQISKLVSLGSLAQLVIRPYRLLRLPKYLRELVAYRRLERRQIGRSARLRLYPCVDDAQASQPVTGYYFCQGCWAARQVFRESPAFVVDVGSTILLVGVMSQFTPCILVDIRPVQAELGGLSTRAGSVLSLPFVDGEVPCPTTMCVLEYVGLGRYGDPLNPKGTEQAIAEIARVIAPGGIVVYSVPIGVEMVEFNANRRFTYAQAAGFFRVGWKLIPVWLPAPAPYVDDCMVLAARDPVACFCMRKPNA